MASPNDDRRSYARRAHYGAFAAYIVAITAVVGGLLASLLWVVDPVGFANLRMLAAEVTAPAGRVVNATTGLFSGSGDAAGAWWRAGSQNRALNDELTIARRQIIRAAALRAENDQLRRMLALTQGEVRPVATAQLLSASASSTRRFAVIDAGFNDGVRTGQPVRSADGLIGRTLEVGPTVSRVQLITDSHNVVPGRRARDGLALLVSGRGDELLDVRALNAAGNPLKVGDLLHSSGSGGLYHAGVPIGIVIRLTSEGGLARPLADPGAAIGVIIDPASDADLDPPPLLTEAVAATAGGEQQ